MKKYLPIILIFIIGHGVAQTNTFPSSGYVGIGTTSPLNGIHVFSNGDLNGGSVRFGYSGAADALLSFGWDGVSQDAFKISKFPHNSVTGSTNFMTILSNTGNVGIGTTSPSSKLDIVTSASSGIRFSLTDGSSYGMIAAYNTPGNHLFSLCRQDGVNAGDLSISAFSGIGLTGGKTTGSATSAYQFYLSSNGNVGIGTTNPSQLLSVAGNIQTKKLIVTQTGWSDYVFYKSYKLRSLLEVEQFIKINKHLPDVPDGIEVAKNGVDVGETEALLLKKIEELTLYMIEMKKENEEMKKEITEIRKKQNSINEVKN